MDANAKNFGCLKTKLRRDTCSVCGTTGSKLFLIPSDEKRYKQLISALKWSVPREKLNYVLKNARVCDRHFSESCFSSTLRQRLIKFACPKITQDLSSTASDTLSALPSAAFQCSRVDVRNAEPLCSECIMDVEPSCSESFMDVEPSCSKRFLSSPTSSHSTSAHLQVTPKTRKIKNLRSSVSKLYEKQTSARFLGQLKAKLADKPHLYNFVTSQLRTQGKDSKGRRWSAKEKSFALQIYLHSPSAYNLLRKLFAFPSKATLHRQSVNAGAILSSRWLVI